MRWEPADIVIVLLLALFVNCTNCFEHQNKEQVKQTVREELTRDRCEVPCD